MTSTTTRKRKRTRVLYATESPIITCCCGKDTRNSLIALAQSRGRTLNAEARIAIERHLEEAA